MDKVCVIGSNSFSGASFCKFLLELGVDVIGVSRSSEPDRLLLPYKWLPMSKQENFRFFKVDINHEMDRLVTIINSEKPKCIVNFSAQSMVGESWDRPSDWMMTNVVSLSGLMERLRFFDFLESYVHVSTPEVYGSTLDFISEDVNADPSTPYAVSRAAGDMLVNLYQKTFDLPIKTTRAANVFGCGQPLFRIVTKSIYSVLSKKKIELHGGGVSRRSFIHIDDVSSATWEIAQSNIRGQTFHISTDRVVTIKNLVALIVEMMGVSFDESVVVTADRLGKDSAYLLSSEKIRKTLGWTDYIGLEDGLDSVIKWACDNAADFCALPKTYVHKS